VRFLFTFILSYSFILFLIFPFLVLQEIEVRGIIVGISSSQENDLFYGLISSPI